MRTLLEKGMVDCDDCNRKDHSLYIFVVITKFDEHTLPAPFVLYLDENQPSFLFPTVTCQVTPPNPPALGTSIRHLDPGQSVTWPERSLDALEPYTFYDINW